MIAQSTMRRPPVPELCALACALLSALPPASAQPAPAQPAQVQPAQVQPVQAQRAQAQRSAQDRKGASALSPAEAPTPSMADIAAAFEPVSGGLTSEEIVKQALEHSPELRKAE